MSDADDLAERYESFAERQAHGSSPSLEAWARAVASHPDLQAAIATLPEPKQQPNLVFAAARWHGAIPGDSDSLRQALLEDFDQVRATILARSTQTNEPARGAMIRLGLSQLTGPVALIELGAAAGLCLAFDQYSYRFSDGATLDPDAGTSLVVIDIEITGAWPQRAHSMPRLAWRGGVDLNPLNPADPDTKAWLSTLIWPEHAARRDRMEHATDLAAALDLGIERGDLRTMLPALLDRVPVDATPVVLHSATLAYLDPAGRAEAADLIRSTGAHWLSYEGRGVVPGIDVPEIPATPDTLFIAAMDGVPYAVGSGHGNNLTVLHST